MNTDEHRSTSLFCPIRVHLWFGILPALSALPQIVIGKYEARHCFDHRDRARQHARVVAALGFQRHGVSAAVDGLLGLANGGGRLERDAEHDVLAVADAALYAAGTVADGAHAALLDGERIVVGDSGQRHTAEPAADLEAFRRWQRHDRARQVGLELVEHRLAEPGRHAATDALDDAAERIAGTPRRV